MFCIKKCFLTDLLETQCLLEILHVSVTVKNSEYMVKSECFENSLQWRPPVFLTEAEKLGLLCKCINIFLTY